MKQLVSLAACCVGVSVLVAQEGERLGPLRPTVPVQEHRHEDEHEEMIRLIQEVEVSLGKIDLQLAQAGTGETLLEDPGGSQVAKLLEGALAKSDEVVRSIDRILSIRDHHDGGGGGG